MVLTVSFALSLVTGLVATIAGGNVISANLTPASGRQDHTTSPSASARFVKRIIQRPPHPVPDVRDDREPPLTWERDRPHRPLIWVAWEGNYFCGEH
jgi:hypothetical protein